MPKITDCGRWKSHGEPMTIAEQVRFARTASGLSQRGAAEAAGISYVHMNRIEKGHSVPSAALLAKLARAFSVRFAIWPEGETDANSTT